MSHDDTLRDEATGDAAMHDIDDARRDPADHLDPADDRSGETATQLRLGQSTLTAVRPLWAIFIRSFAFLRKEVVEILRQPRLVALLVAGPFALLVAFGLGYSDTTLVKRAIFVGPADSMYEDVLAEYEDDLGDFITSVGFVNSEDEGMAALRGDEADIVVIFPNDPVSTVITGERAVITMVHDEIDPIQEGAVEIAARLAIQEVNSTVLTTLATGAGEALPDSLQIRDRLVQLSQELTDDPVGTRAELIEQLDQIDLALNGSETVLGSLELESSDRSDQLRSTREQALALTQDLANVSESTTDEELVALAESVEALTVELDETVVLDPAVLVQPFESRTDNVLEGRINPTEYFTPSSLALLLQHLALTFAALSLVRDRRTGLFELMRVGPMSAIEIILGKVIAYLFIGTLVGSVLVTASVIGLSVPLVGSVVWVGVTIIGVLLASLALGMMLAIVSNTESQAVQYAMLALLAGLFFSGFLLPIATLAYPVKLVSWLLPVTYGIQSFQNVMLRGIAPESSTLYGLGALVLLYGGLAVFGLRRQLRSGVES